MSTSAPAAAEDARTAMLTTSPANPRCKRLHGFIAVSQGCNLGVQLRIGTEAAPEATIRLRPRLGATEASASLEMVGALPPADSCIA